MEIGKDIPEIGADDFARRFSLRAGNLMWLLGAGASASAGIPTAGDMMFGRFLQREMFGIPMNVFLQYVVPVLSVPALILFKYADE